MNITQEGLLLHFGGYTYSMQECIEEDNLCSIITLTSGEEITGQEFLDRYFSPEEDIDKSSDGAEDWNYYDSSWVN
jgi:hypothetical protein